MEQVTRDKPHAAQSGFDFELVPSESASASTFEAIFNALENSSRSVAGPARPRLLVIPLNDGDGTVIGGFWGCTMFQWLHVQMLFVPEIRRGQGIGSALMAAAETAAWARGCLDVRVDTFSFQAVPFYRKLGFIPYATLKNYPPGHCQLFFRKRIECPLRPAD